MRNNFLVFGEPTIKKKFVVVVLQWEWGFLCEYVVGGDMNGHTMRTIPHPVRSGKSNLIWPGQ
jgi:hypothetical protein